MDSLKGLWRSFTFVVKHGDVNRALEERDHATARGRGAGTVKRLSRVELAGLIEDVADRVQRNDLAYGIQVLISEAQFELLELQHIEGIQLLNRIGLLQGEAEGSGGHRYGWVQQTIEKMLPLDPGQDSQALRDLAGEIREGSGSS